MSAIRLIQLSIIGPDWGFDVEFEFAVKTGKETCEKLKQAALLQVNRLLKERDCLTQLTLGELQFCDKDSQPLGKETKVLSLPFCLPEKNEPIKIYGLKALVAVKLNRKAKWQTATEQAKPEAARNLHTLADTPTTQGQATRGGRPTIHTLASLPSTNNQDTEVLHLQKIKSATLEELKALVAKQKSLAVTDGNRAEFKKSLIELLNRADNNEVLNQYYLYLKPNEDASYSDDFAMLHERIRFKPGSFFYKFRSHETTKTWSDILAALKTKMMINVIQDQNFPQHANNVDMVRVKNEMLALSKHSIVNHSRSHHCCNFFKSRTTMRRKIDSLLEDKISPYEAASTYYDYRSKSYNLGLSFGVQKYSVVSRR